MNRGVFRAFLLLGEKDEKDEKGEKGEKGEKDEKGRPDKRREARLP